MNKKLHFDIDKNKLNYNNGDKEKQIEILRETAVQFNTFTDKSSKLLKETIKNRIHEQEKSFSLALDNKAWKAAVKITKKDSNSSFDSDDEYNVVSYYNKKKTKCKVPDNLLNITDVKKRNMIKDVYCKKMKNLSDEIDVMNDIQKNIDLINNEINYLENKRKKKSLNSFIRKKFNSVKNNRSQCFMNFFCQLVIDVNEIYSVIKF